jgi:hypothetical protein
VLVLALFVVATVLLLGVVHPTSVTVASDTAVTTTTAPVHPVPTTTTIPPAKVSVLVANATSVAGAAAAVANELQPGGWNLLPVVNATARVGMSEVDYVSGYATEASTVAKSLGLAASAVTPYTTSAPISTIGTAQILVVVGPDLAAKAAPAAATTTTAR